LTISIGNQNIALCIDARLLGDVPQLVLQVKCITQLLQILVL